MPPCACVCACATSALVAGLKRNCFGGGRGGCSGAPGVGVPGCGCAVPGAEGVPTVVVEVAGVSDVGARKNEHADTRAVIARVGRRRVLERIRR